MLIVGSKGHAKELLEVINPELIDQLVFFDNVTKPEPKVLFNTFKVLNSLEEAEHYFKTVSPKFATGIGSTHSKKNITEQLENLGGELQSVIDNNASIGHYDVVIGKGANIMKQVMISNSVTIGKAALVNFGASIHHDCKIGDYAEISPKASILGRCTIGNFVSIGTGAIILPDVKIGDHVVVGAGAVVTKSIASNCKVVGVPAKAI